MNNQNAPELPITKVSPEEPLQKSKDTLEVENLILGKLDDFETKLDEFRHIFEQRLSYDKEKEKAFDLLYSELQAVRENSAFNQVKPLYFDLILLLDRVENIEKSVTEQNFSEYSNGVKNILDSVNEEILEILLRQEIEVINSHPGMPFDPSQQKAIQIHNTSVESENNTIFSIIRHGFRYGNRILRAEEVVVSKYQPA